MIHNALHALKNSSQANFGMTEVCQNDIDLWLSLYKPEAILIERAVYHEGLIDATLALYPLDFHRAPLLHLSRVQIVHFVGQVAFVLAGSMVRDGMLSELTEKSYLDAILNEGVTFRKLALEFRKVLPNERGTRIQMRCRRIRKIKSGVLLDLEFTLNEGACRGKAQGFIFNSGYKTEFSG